MERLRPRRPSKAASTASYAIGRSNPFGAGRKAGSHNLTVAEIKQRCYDTAVRVGNSLARADALITNKRKKSLLTGTTGMDRYLDHLALELPRLFMHELLGKWIAQEHKVGVQDDVEVQYESYNEACAALRERYGIHMDPDVLERAMAPRLLKPKANDDGTGQTNGIDGKDAKTGRFLPGNPFGAGRKAGSNNLIASEIRHRCYDAAVRVGNALARADALVTNKRKKVLLPGTTGMDRYLDHLALHLPQLFMHELFGEWIAQEIAQEHKVGAQDKVDVRYKTLEEARAALRDRGIDPDVIEQAMWPKFTVINEGLGCGR